MQRAEVDKRAAGISVRAAEREDARALLDKDARRTGLVGDDAEVSEEAVGFSNTDGRACGCPDLDATVGIQSINDRVIGIIGGGQPSAINDNRVGDNRTGQRAETAVILEGDFRAIDCDRSGEGVAGIGDVYRAIGGATPEGETRSGSARNDPAKNAGVAAAAGSVVRYVARDGTEADECQPVIIARAGESKVAADGKTRHGISVAAGRLKRAAVDGHGSVSERLDAGDDDGPGVQREATVHRGGPSPRIKPQSSRAIFSDASGAGGSNFLTAPIQ